MRKSRIIKQLFLLVLGAIKLHSNAYVVNELIFHNIGRKIEF